MENKALNESDMLNICGWCKSIKQEGNLLSETQNPSEYQALIQEYKPDNVSHGICEPCSDRMISDWGGIK